ncbi:hypothetical protein PanWU01x14_367910 [Parasponia andersonii]|uniref:Uncharacterized protein n=1 Tax=Parasponia andersonii TaxID=3476 RepID=A0A2P5A557_PARAD|nr:hypothetical protein PanWU01x14_367910 [Parasponia andersonii]
MAFLFKVSSPRILTATERRQAFVAPAMFGAWGMVESEHLRAEVFWTMDSMALKIGSPSVCDMIKESWALALVGADVVVGWESRIRNLR